MPLIANLIIITVTEFAYVLTVIFAFEIKPLVKIMANP